MTIFITGTTGYIGHKLALAAVAKGFQVHALVRDLASPNKPLHKNIRFFQGDVTDYASIIAAVQGCDYVMHAAAVTQLWDKDTSKFYRVNVKGTQNVLEAAIRHQVKRFVFTSSCTVLSTCFEHPVCEDDPRLTAFENDYEISKYSAELLVKEYTRNGLFAVIVCPPRVYGPGLNTRGNPINKIIGNLVTKSIAIVPGSGQVVANYAYIDDVVEGHFLSMQKGLGGEKYILGGENLSYKQFVDTVRMVSQKKITVIPAPKFLLKTCSGLAYAAHYLLGRHTHVSPQIVDRLFQNRALNCQKAIKQLGYRITPFSQGIDETIRYLKEEAASRMSDIRCYSQPPSS